MATPIGLGFLKITPRGRLITAENSGGVPFQGLLRPESPLSSIVVVVNGLIVPKTKENIQRDIRFLINNREYGLLANMVKTATSGGAETDPSNNHPTERRIREFMTAHPRKGSKNCGKSWRTEIQNQETG